MNQKVADFSGKLGHFAGSSVNPRFHRRTACCKSGHVRLSLVLRALRFNRSIERNRVTKIVGVPKRGRVHTKQKRKLYHQVQQMTLAEHKIQSSCVC